MFVSKLRRVLDAVGIVAGIAVFMLAMTPLRMNSRMANVIGGQYQDLSAGCMNQVAFCTGSLCAEDTFYSACNLYYTVAPNPYSCQLATDQNGRWINGCGPSCDPGYQSACQ